MNVWKPTDQRLSKKDKEGLLPKAEKLLREILSVAKVEQKLGSSISDRYGRYATTGAIKISFATWNYVLIARSYIYGNIIGCSRDIMQRALAENKYILIYIDKIQQIYAFNAREVYRLSTTSTRDGLRIYYDFKIHNGKNLTVWLEELKERIAQAEQTKLMDFVQT